MHSHLHCGLNIYTAYKIIMQVSVCDYNAILFTCSNSKMFLIEGLLVWIILVDE